MCQTSRSHLVGWFWLRVSHKNAIKMSTKAAVISLKISSKLTHDYWQDSEAVLPSSLMWLLTSPSPLHMEPFSTHRCWFFSFQGCLKMWQLASPRRVSIKKERGKRRKGERNRTQDWSSSLLVFLQSNIPRDILLLLPFSICSLERIH